MSTMSRANPSLNTRIRSLPNELQDMVFTELLRSLLQPGKVYPKGSEDHTTATSRTRPELIHTLQGIPSHWWAKAFDMFYGTNTWVLPAGDWVPGTNFFLRLPQPIVDRIVSVELDFKWEDGASYFENGAREWFDLAARAGRGRQLQQADMSSYVALEPVIQPIVIQVWRKKLATVRTLRLQHLRLDFSKMRDGRGVFRGWEVLYWCPLPFTYGEPRHLEILAPAGLLYEAAIRGAIRDWNANDLRSAECSFCRDGLH